VNIAEFWEDLRLGVISHSNWVIAGFLRNICKYSKHEKNTGVEELSFKVNLNICIFQILYFICLVRHGRAKVPCQKGNSPDRSVRCLIISKWIR